MRNALTRPIFLYQSELEFFSVNSPIALISCGFRALQRLNLGALECASHRCTSFFCHTPMQLRECRRRSIRR